MGGIPTGAVSWVEFGADDIGGNPAGDLYPTVCWTEVFVFSGGKACCIVFCCVELIGGGIIFGYLCRIDGLLCLCVAMLNVGGTLVFVIGFKGRFPGLTWLPAIKVGPVGGGCIPNRGCGGFGAV